MANEINKHPEQPPILQKIIHLLAEKNQLASINKIYLFGSRARGDASARSDIDLAIACPNANSRTWLDIKETIEETPTLLKIDILRLEEATPELRKKIIEEGKIIYE